MILQDRIAVITGAGSGIGRGGAEILAREGAHVVVADLSIDRSEETVEIIKKAGGSAETKPTDVTDNDALEKLIVDTTTTHPNNSLMVISDQITPAGDTIPSTDNKIREIYPHFIIIQNQ